MDADRRSIADITITAALAERPGRARDPAAEIAAIRRLADTMAHAPANIFQACVDSALDLCAADTCGISLYERTPAGDDIFRWIALTGRLKEHLNGTTPRHFSPCGICVDDDAPLLMRRPELVYTYLDVGPPFHEALLIPLTHRDSAIEGTIWVVTHDPERKFDGEDARIMQRIAIFVATALHLRRAADEARAETSAKDVQLQELDHRVKNTLQMTASLLRMQLAGVTDPAARAAVDAARNRVLAIGQMHRIGANAAAGDLVAVVRSVCADVVGADNPRIRVTVNGPPGLTVPAHQAAPMALIVNELVTNAMKHAFGPDGTGSVTVFVARAAPDRVECSVIDDGLPLPDGGARPGLGLTLVRRLAEQIGGDIAIDGARKRFTVSFSSAPAHAA